MYRLIEYFYQWHVEFMVNVKNDQIKNLAFAPFFWCQNSSAPSSLKNDTDESVGRGSLHFTSSLPSLILNVAAIGSYSPVVIQQLIILNTKQLSPSSFLWYDTLLYRNLIFAELLISKTKQFIVP